jgi:hypothetical protein
MTPKTVTSEQILMFWPQDATLFYALQDPATVYPKEELEGCLLATWTISKWGLMDAKGFHIIALKDIFGVD